MNDVYLIGSGIAIQPQNIKAFYECWKDNEATCRAMEVTLNSKSTDYHDATVLKVGCRDLHYFIVGWSCVTMSANSDYLSIGCIVPVLCLSLIVNSLLIFKSMIASFKLRLLADVFFAVPFFLLQSNNRLG